MPSEAIQDGFGPSPDAATQLAMGPQAAPNPARALPAQFAATHAAADQVDALGFALPVSAARTTILPRVEGDSAPIRLSLDSRSRYEPTKLLGTGGMGEVLLVDDHDIERKVAVKRLLPDLTSPAILARFVDEIRTVGRLEHPNIVPIHDVGVDELGRYFFVMKYVEGETLESIIAKLAAGDAAYTAKYSLEVRTEIFLGVLHALEYAHAKGVVHRDVKPANVMIGRYGEVMLMDWGIAKPIASKRDAAAGAEAALAPKSDAKTDSERGRMYATRVGALIGTPAYMSPEQARGETEIDARSDLYSAAVLLHELLGLRHYLADRPTVKDLLEGVLTEEFGLLKLFGLKYPGAAPPAAYIHIVRKGIAKDPTRRYQSASQFIAALRGVLEGNVEVLCHITLTKRAFSELVRLVDKAPYLALVTLLALWTAVGFTIVQLVRMALA